MLNILGLNFGHDGSAAILKQGRLVAAISNERLSRRKKAAGVTREMIQYVLEMAGLNLSEINAVAFTSFFYNPGNYVKVFALTGQEVTSNLLDLEGGRALVECVVEIDKCRFKGAFVHHHMAHVASAYYTSPFKAAACFSLDSSLARPEACSLFAYGIGDKVYYLQCPGLMIGNLYHDFTEKLGVGPGLMKAGTTMALASLGKPLPVAVDRWEKFAQPWYHRTCQNSDALFISRVWGELSGHPPHVHFSREQIDSQRARDIAASVQFIFEQAVVQAANELYEATRTYNEGNLCLVGGSFLNSKANMEIKTKTPFERIHLFPACGDDGTAAGAALFLAHDAAGVPRCAYEPRDYMYLGRKYDVPSSVGEAYDVGAVARALSEGKIVAWFRGRSEFGPRALGHRSILADPRRAEMKDILNHRVKRREWFRPFAPVVLSSKAREWFDIDFESKLMLFIAPIKQAERIPAVAHTDQSARLQTLERADEPELYELIEAFEAITGVPILLNTSLNGNNEPLVETPQDALNFFNQSQVDVLVLEDRVVWKKVNGGSAAPALAPCMTFARET